MRWRVVVALLCAALLSSCGGRIDELREGVRLGGVERVTQHGTAGADLDVRVTNTTPRRVTVKAAEIEIFSGGHLLGGIVLHDKVHIPGRSDGVVSLRWKLRFADRMNLYRLKRKILRGETSDIRINYRVKGRCGLLGANISAQGVGLSEFLNIFGIDTEELKKYLES